MLFVTKNVLNHLNGIFAVFLCHVNQKLDCGLLVLFVFNIQLLVKHLNLFKNQHQYMCAANHWKQTNNCNDMEVTHVLKVQKCANIFKTITFYQKDMKIHDLIL